MLNLIKAKQHNRIFYLISKIAKTENNLGAFQ